MANTTELERTFLVGSLPDGIGKARKVEMEDIYIPASAEHPVIRIRKIGERMEITKKSPVDASDRSEQHEHTIELTREEFDSLAGIGGKRVAKTRHFMDIGDRKAEIDVFRGPLEGLVVADFEFGSAEERDAFRPPEFCLADVTQEEFIAGGMLCGKSYSDVESHLKRFGYKKILV